MELGFTGGLVRLKDGSDMILLDSECSFNTLKLAIHELAVPRQGELICRVVDSMFQLASNIFELVLSAYLFKVKYSC